MADGRVVGRRKQEHRRRFGFDDERLCRAYAAHIDGVAGELPSLGVGVEVVPTHTEIEVEDVPPFPDLVNRGFQPAVANTVWYGDITYIWVESRFWYLATVIDASSRMVIGWQLADHMRAGLAIDALNAAIADGMSGLVRAHGMPIACP